MNGVEFAAVDVETTGLFPRGHDRVVEIGIVVVDEAGQRKDGYSTLVNPGRDLGPTDVHGIRGRDVVGAPTLADVIGDVSAQLRDRVLVAHNARFDRDFIAAEFERAGYALPVVPWLCTMEIGALATGVRRLGACCEALQLPVTPSHSASDDAWAAALILNACLAQQGVRALVEDALEDVRRVGPDGWPPVAPSGGSVPRSRGRPPRRETYVGTLLDRLPLEHGLAEGAGAAYLELLDRVLEDRVLTAAEADALIELAASWGIGRNDCVALHDLYMRGLVGLALQDGILTDAEQADLDDVAALLAIAPAALQEMLSAAFVDEEPVELPSSSRSEDLEGRTVCFTGQLTCTINGEQITRERAEALAAKSGLIVKGNVSKKLDLLVVADPDSLSGKARKAREFGARIMVERAFWRALAVDVD